MHRVERKRERGRESGGCSVKGHLQTVVSFSPREESSSISLVRQHGFNHGSKITSSGLSSKPVVTVY